MPTFVPRRVLITGGGGFVGRHVIAAARAEWPAAELHVADLVPADGVDRAFVCDLTDPAQTADMLAAGAPDAVVHLAGILGPPDLERLFRANVLATDTLLTALERAGSAARVVVSGSAAEYGILEPGDMPVTESHACRPISEYGLSKAWQTEVALMHVHRGADVVVGRIFNLIGVGMPETLFAGSVAAQLRALPADGGEVAVGDLAPRRDHLDAADAARALIALVGDGVRGRAYNVCSGHSVSMREVFDALAAASGKRAAPRSEPGRSRATDVPDIYGSHELIERDTGWCATIALEESARRMFEAG